jgi:hypothetical protein
LYLASSWARTTSPMLGTAPIAQGEKARRQRREESCAPAWVIPPSLPRARVLLPGMLV